MAWSTSKVFAAMLENALANAVAYDLSGTPDTFKAALYDNDITPDNNASLANTAYNAGQWVTTGNEVADGTEWDAGGEPLVSPALTTTTGTVKWDANDTVSGGTSATLTAVHGCLVYDDTLAQKYGICYNYFGGAQSVTDGTFTIIWSTNGIFTIAT
jgi:hypothetical protein